MTTYDSTRRRRFYRNSDRACIAGVCAGLADYFGFNLKATRILAFISLLCAMPFTLLAYFGAVFLFPSAPGRKGEPYRDDDPKPPPPPTMDDVRSRLRSLDDRLATLERYVTSSHFDLDEEFRKL